MRGQPRLVYQPQHDQRLLDLQPSPANALEFCVGTLAEMTAGDIYETVDYYSRQGRLAYVHLRDITGKVPHYRETFIDDSDGDMVRGLLARRHGLRAGLYPSSVENPGLSRGRWAPEDAALCPLVVPLPKTRKVREQCPGLGPQVVANCRLGDASGTIWAPQNVAFSRAPKLALT